MSERTKFLGMPAGILALMSSIPWLVVLLDWVSQSIDGVEKVRGWYFADVMAFGIVGSGLAVVLAVAFLVSWWIDRRSVAGEE